MIFWRITSGTLPSIKTFKNTVKVILATLAIELENW